MKCSIFGVVPILLSRVPCMQLTREDRFLPDHEHLQEHFDPVTLVINVNEHCCEEDLLDDLHQGCHTEFFHNLVDVNMVKALNEERFKSLSLYWMKFNFDHPQLTEAIDNYSDIDALFKQRFYYIRRLDQRRSGYPRISSIDIPIICQYIAKNESDSCARMIQSYLINLDLDSFNTFFLYHRLVRMKLQDMANLVRKYANIPELSLADVSNLDAYMTNVHKSITSGDFKAMIRALRSINFVFLPYFLPFIYANLDMTPDSVSNLAKNLENCKFITDIYLSTALMKLSHRALFINSIKDEKMLTQLLLLALEEENIMLVRIILQTKRLCFTTNTAESFCSKLCMGTVGDFGKDTCLMLMNQLGEIPIKYHSSIDDLHVRLLYSIYEDDEDFLELKIEDVSEIMCAAFTDVVPRLDTTELIEPGLEESVLKKLGKLGANFLFLLSNYLDPLKTKEGIAASGLSPLEFFNPEREHREDALEYFDNLFQDNDHLSNTQVALQNTFKLAKAGSFKLFIKMINYLKPCKLFCMDLKSKEVLIEALPNVQNDGQARQAAVALLRCQFKGWERLRLYLSLYLSISHTYRDIFTSILHFLYLLEHI